jgi:hypothetical protein
MKVRTTVTVSEHDRLVVAKFFGAAAPAGSRDAARTRATRGQVRRFLAHALRSGIREQVGVLRGRSRAAANRLLSPLTEHETPPLPEPLEKQLSLL